MSAHQHQSNIEETILKAEAIQAEIKLSLQFKKNMVFFKKNSPFIYERYCNYKPKEQKVFFDTKGYVNLLNIKSQTPSFIEDPKIFAKKQVDQFCKKPIKLNMGFKSVESWNKKHIHLSITNNLLDKYENLSFKDNPASMDIMGFVVIIGCGLGHHITEIIKKKDVKNLFIYDGNRDSFFASLYTTDWEYIVTSIKSKGGSIKIAIGETCFDALSTMRNLSKEIGLFNINTSFVLLHTLSEENQLFFDQYRKSYHLNGTGMGFFDDEQVSLAHTIDNIHQKLPVFYPNKKLKQQLPPAVLIGNGPSIDYLEDFIKNNQNSLIIISCGSAINTLFKMGIKPDLHVEMERSRTIATWRSKDINLEYLKGIPLLALNTLSPETTALFKETRMAIKPNDLGGHLIKQELGEKNCFELPFCNPTVANCTLSYLDNFGFTKIYLAGTDFGMVSAEDHHSKHSVHQNIDKIFHASQNNVSSEYSYGNDQYLRPGNFGGEILTTNVLDTARNNIELSLKNNPNITCFNLNNGLHISGATPIKQDNLPTFDEPIDKGSIIEKLFSQHFIKIDHTKFNKEYIQRKHIDPLFKMRDGFLLPKECHNINMLHDNLFRIFKNLKSLEESGLACYILLSGSTQVHLALLYYYCSRASNEKEFSTAFLSGKDAYHSLLNQIFDFMKERSFELDDSTVTFEQTIS